MQIALLTSEKSSINPLGLVEKRLAENIAGLDVSKIVVPNNLDLVREIYDAGKFDLVCVILYYDRDSADISILMQKIVELELSGRRIAKFIEQDPDADEQHEAECISDSIMLKLFGKIPKKDGN